MNSIIFWDALTFPSQKDELTRPIRPKAQGNGSSRIDFFAVFVAAQKTQPSQYFIQF